jgi:uncharacterized membrane protein YphA (DoxX/SURF4 family)
MAIDRQGNGLAVLRILIGVFFLCQGLGKLRWFLDTSILSSQLAAWHRDVAAGTISAQYLERFAMPYAGLFARLVPAAEIISGIALVLGFRTSLSAMMAFVMVVNFHVAGGTIFHYAFLTNPYGLPVLGGTLALALGGVRLPLSLRG